MISAGLVSNGKTGVFLIRGGEVHVQEDYFGHRDLVNLDCIGGISAKRMKQSSTGEGEYPSPLLVQRVVEKVGK